MRVDRSMRLVGITALIFGSVQLLRDRNTLASTFICLGVVFYVVGLSERK